MPGRLVLVFDDGYADDYDAVWPVLREFGAPACFAVVSEWVGGPDSLSRAQLRELADSGCEVAAHGRRHRYLQAYRLAADAGAGDRRLRVEGDTFADGDHGTVVGDAFEVTDGDRREVRELVGATDDALEFAEPLDAAFAAAETVVRYAPDVVRDEVAGAGEALRAAGFDPSTFVLPYDAGDARAWRLVGEHYAVLPDASVRSLPNPPGTDPLNLRRYYLETDALTDLEVREYLDSVADRDGLGVLAGHSAWDTVPPERVASVLRAARERGVEVTTFAALYG